MQRTQTRLRMGVGLVAMMAVLALVAVMTMVSSNGTTSVSAEDPLVTPSSNYKILAKVNTVVIKNPDQSAAGIYVTITQPIIVGKEVIWKGQRWVVNNVKTVPPVPVGKTLLEMTADPCKKQDDANNYPPDEKYVYQALPCDTNLKVLGTVVNVVPPSTIDVIKADGQKTAVGDLVVWNGLRWRVTARTPADPQVKAATLVLEPNPCAKQDPADYPVDAGKYIYLPKPCDDGNLSGIYDLQVMDPSKTLTLYHCISRQDHDLKTNDIKTSVICYIDIAGTEDPADVLGGVNVPGEGIDFPNPGPPPPPPYTIVSPSKGLGFFDKDGSSAECQFYFPTAAQCSVIETCFEDIGAGSLGPNLGVRLVVGDPKDNPAQGKVELNSGLSKIDCNNLTMPAIGTNDALAFKSTRAAVGSVPWRTNATDFDGDGCSDLDELAKDKARPKGCGDDPYNPLDSNKTDFSGSYSIQVRVLRAEQTPGFGGIYFSCIADIQQTGTGKADGELVARAHCYTDSFFGEVNAVGYPGVTGDGYPGGGPGYLAIPQEGPDPETNCARGVAGVSLDEDGDTVANDGCPSEGFGDVDSKHTELTGFVDNSDNTLKLRGCFDDEDASSSVGIVYTEMTVNRNTGVGTVDIWTEQTSAHCVAGAPFGTYVGDGGAVGPPVGAFDDADITVVRQPGGKTRDTDQDGIPNAVELRDNGAANCGLRDPANPYDWYDVNQDGVIDLLNDILGVISHYSPGGAPPYNANWDRPPAMTGGAGHWNRGAPDGVIDLLNDILGVISQYHPGAC